MSPVDIIREIDGVQDGERTVSDGETLPIREPHRKKEDAFLNPVRNPVDSLPVNFAVLPTQFLVVLLDSLVDAPAFSCADWFKWNTVQHDGFAFFLVHDSIPSAIRKQKARDAGHK